jgi:HEPN domain-containing protein
MDSQEKFERWLEIAQNDLAAAETMFNSDIWVYVVFWCQQAVEKLVKGLYILYKDDDVPYINNIGEIMSRFEDKLPISVSKEKYDLFDELSAYYIKIIYVDYNVRIDKILNKEISETILTKSKEVFAWLLTLKK